MLLAGG
ncbi:hypothetical protein YPPY46_1493, partial [Yersinia pestis PY-46]